MATPDPSAPFVAVTLLQRLLADENAGGIRPLSHYQEVFPGHEELVAREYEALTGPRGDAAAFPDSLPPGEALGRFRIEALLGRGGQATVYRARDERLGRTVALKVLNGLGPGASDILERFRREAELASRLDHPAICTVYESGFEGSVPWIAMRFVEGETLAARIARGRNPPVAGRAAAAVATGPATSRDTATTSAPARREMDALLLIFETCARALHHAHEAGIVHRDLKPGNILITAAGDPVILDFGLAREIHGGHPSLTQTGDLFGTPAYMSPEQLSTRRVPVDRRTDIWSLGVSLFEAVTLRRPFEAPARDGLYRAILSEEPEDPRRSNGFVSSDLKAVLDTAMEKDPERRYARASDLAEDLRRVRCREPIRARRPGTALRARRWVQRNPRLAAALGALILSLAGGLAVALHLLAGTRSLLGDLRRSYDHARAKGLMGAAIDRSNTEETLALLLAREAFHADRSPETLSVLRNVLATVRERRVLRLPASLNFAIPSGDGRRILAACWGGSVSLLDLEGDRTVVLDHPACQVSSGAFSPDGRRIATASRTQVRLFDQDGEPVGRVIACAPPRPTSYGSQWSQMIAFSPFGERLAIAGQGGRVLLIDDQGELLKTFAVEPGGSVVSVAVSPDGRKILAGLEDGSARLWTLEGGRQIALSGGQAELTYVAFAPRGDQLVTASDDGSAVIWSGDGEEIRRVRHQDRIERCTWSADGRRLLTASLDHTARIWDLEDSTTPVVLPHPAVVIGAAFSPDARSVLTWSADNTARLWTADGEEIAKLRGSGDMLSSGAFVPDGRKVITASRDGTVRVWDAEVEGFPVLAGHRLAVLGGAWSPRGDRIATAGADGHVLVWDTDGRLLVDGMASSRLLWAVAFTPQADRVLWSGSAGRVGSVEVESGRLGILSETDAEVQALALPPDGPDGFILASGSKGVSLRSLEGAIVRRFRPTRWATAAAISRDGAWVAGALERERDTVGNSEVVLWRRDDEEPVLRFDEGEVQGLAFDPSGGRLAVANRQGLVRVRHLEGERVEEYLHGCRVTGVAFSPDGRRLAIACADGIARIRDLESGGVEEVRAGGMVWSVAFAPDGRRLLTTQANRVARVWPLDEDEILRLTAARLSRGFTASERERYADLLTPR